MKRKVAALLLLLAAMFSTAFTGLPAYADGASVYTVLPCGANVYAETNLDSAVLISLESGAKVTVSETLTVDNVLWYRTEAAGRTGYVLASALYQKLSPERYTVRYAKVTGDKSGADIYVYSAPSSDASVIAEVSDGERLLLTGASSNGFLEVELDNAARGYVLSSALVTNGLTYHQYLAMIVGLVCLVAVIAIVLLAHFNKNKKKN